jgi:hypothetical protein
MTRLLSSKCLPLQAGNNGAGATPDKSQLLDKYIYDEMSYDGRDLYRVVGQPQTISCSMVPPGALPKPCTSLQGFPRYKSEPEIDLVSRIDCSGIYYILSSNPSGEQPESNQCTIIGDEDVWVG